MNQELQSKKVLIIEDPESKISLAINSVIAKLMEELSFTELESERIFSEEEALPVVTASMDYDCFLVSTDMDFWKDEEHITRKLLNRIRCRQPDVPVFLLADREKTSRKLNTCLMSLADEFVWILEDSPRFIAGRIESAIARYRNALMPPLMKAIWNYNETHHEYSWAAPGHQGGIGFTKTPAGKKFYDFYGENLFRTDTGIERSSIGSLLDHQGAFRESELLAAEVFGADESYSMVGGTSSANRTLFQACVTEKDFVLCDRNCHKSIEQGLILTGASPVYMIPTRNRYGIIGPIPPSELTLASLGKKLKESIFCRDSNAPLAYSVVTNCTYDGICYNAKRMEELLTKAHLPRIHFDEAWYAYARFHEIYKDHFAMRGVPDKNGPAVYATHSTHKLLNALSQASYIHIRHGSHKIDFDRFNQAYMIHSTTSPLYAICASNDIATGMMKESGPELIREVIAEAVDFRQAVARLEEEFSEKGEWFFHSWNPETIHCSCSGKSYPFSKAPRELLIRRQSCWVLDPAENWHGFAGLEENYAMLDPIKVSILSPGMGSDGKFQEHGIPAQLVSAFLYREGIVPTRTTDFQLMFLFSMGITKGKWGTLLNTLLKFKEFYDKNVPVDTVLPSLVKEYPHIYKNMKLQTLSDKMFDFITANDPTGTLNKAFSSLPEQKLTPRKAYERIVSNEVEFVPLDQLENRTGATAVIPYPPGIPLLMSGESFGSAGSAWIQYLRVLEKWDRLFPGFEHVTEGVKVTDGRYSVLCVK
jgi:arginine decarboxylase